METKYIDYAIDDNGYITRLNEEKIRQTEQNAHRLRFYSTLETEETTEYQANINFTRADGLTIGPLALIYAQDDTGAWHRYIDLRVKLTEITGMLKYSVSYEKWVADEDGVLTLNKRFPIFAISTYVYDCNQNIYDEHYDIYQRLNEVEYIAQLAMQHTTEIIKSETEPSDKVEGKIWFKIL